VGAGAGQALEAAVAVDVEPGGQERGFFPTERGLFPFDFCRKVAGGGQERGLRDRWRQDDDPKEKCAQYGVYFFSLFSCDRRIFIDYFLSHPSTFMFICYFSIFYICI
jgi:hypothetical protein